MSLDRRRFLLGSLAAAATSACGGDARTATSRGPRMTAKPTAAPPTKSMLILGGTGFLGPHIVRSALERGHKVTLFNRGKTQPHLFPEVEKLHGDRDGKLDALKGRKWDAVIDPSGYVPRIVKMSAELLAPATQHYVFISTISVYKDGLPIGADESAPVNTIADPANEDVQTNYGALKALSERAAEAAMPGRVANIRPGLIIGPGDPTGRFTHWPARCSDGGEVLAPGDGSTPVQYIDGRDLGAWIVRLVEQRAVGVMNALGPERLVTMKEVLDACNAAAGNKATLTWVDEKFLEKQEVAPWAEMPLWIPAEGDYIGIGRMSNARAIKAGLTFRPIAETARDTLSWLETLPDDKRSKVRSSGIKPEKEARVLAAWKARS
jgi:2'-hydroxyisoflavone reductase